MTLKLSYAPKTYLLINCISKLLKPLKTPKKLWSPPRGCSACQAGFSSFQKTPSRPEIIFNVLNNRKWSRTVWPTLGNLDDEVNISKTMRGDLVYPNQNVCFYLMDVPIQIDSEKLWSKQFQLNARLNNAIRQMVRLECVVCCTCFLPSKVDKVNEGMVNDWNQAQKWCLIGPKIQQHC